jgi:RNA polymerase sigma-70 factor (ECF subfamily)
MLTQSQGRLYAYILSLLPESNTARDVLQETNVVLWRKADQFVEGTNFIAWAYSIARTMVLTSYRQRQRDRHIFDESLVAMLADESEDSDREPDLCSRILDECLLTLSPKQRELLTQRYGPSGSVAAIARGLGRTPASVSVTLSRLRHALVQCVRRKLAGAS